MELSILYLVLIVGGLLACYYIPKNYDNRIFQKYGQHIFDWKTGYATGLFAFIYFLSILVDFLVYISTPIIIFIMCRQLRICWEKCVTYGFSKSETRWALFHQIFYSIGIFWLILSFVSELARLFGINRRRYR